MRQLVEHEFEEIPGIPGRLPKDEHLIWQGKPNWWQVALHVFHIRLIGLYFVVLAVWRVYTGFVDGIPLTQNLLNASTALVLGMGAISIFLVWARLIQKSTVYSITSKRLLMRVGVALPITLNLPFSKLAAAAGKKVSSKTNSGNLSFDVLPEERIGWLMVWPHTRPWHMTRAQPSFRHIDNFDAVAETLATALERDQRRRQLRGELTAAQNAVTIKATGQKSHSDRKTISSEKGQTVPAE